jgi:hypothetical protein
MKVSLNGELIIKFKHFENVDNAEDVLTNEEIKNNIVEIVGRKLKDNLKEVEVEVVDFNVMKTIDK